MIEASATLIYLFASLSVLVCAAFPVGVYLAERRLGRERREARRVAALAGIGAWAWLTVTGGAAAAGFLTFDGRPPTMMVAVTAMWALAAWIGFSRIGERLAMGLPLAALVGVHAFRLPLELLMHRAYQEGVMPVQMSYSGWNFDILTGATAVAVTALLLSGRMPIRGVRLWNWLGIALLTNVVVLAMLSTPVPIRVFWNEPANVWITRPPFVWLPMVMVLTAMVGHIVLSRRLLAEASRRGSPTSAGDRATAPLAQGVRIPAEQLYR
jgi:hypothetical protein